jgi:hypothetical protein
VKLANKLLLTLPLLLLLAGCRPGTIAPLGTVAVEPAGKRSLNRPLTEINLAEIGAVAPKGRVQDTECNQVPLVEELLAHGKESIPYLISKLDDETRVDTHVVDYWYKVHIADVALIVLSDFFTNRTWKSTTIPGVGWDQFLERGNDPNLTGEQVLRNYIARHGRHSIKTRWQQIWETHQDKIFWDETERCFKLAQL